MKLLYQPHPDMDRSDLQRLAATSLLHDQILKDFLNGLISPDDFLEMYAETGVLMDSFCQAATQDLEQIGLIL